jgi:hypothetical protein
VSQSLPETNALNEGKRHLTVTAVSHAR